MAVKVHFQPASTKLLELLREALGIEHPVFSITLRVGIDEVVSAEVRFPITRAQDAKVAEVLERHVFPPTAPDPEPPAGA